MSLSRLDRTLLNSGFAFPSDLLVGVRRPLPERVLQFGGGNFLRCFADMMIDGANARGLFGGSVVIVQSVGAGGADKMNAQGGCYTVVRRGIENGARMVERRLVTAVSRAVNPSEDFAAYRRLAAEPAFRFVISNTTEAGIAYAPEPHTPDAPQKSFPAKVCAFLAERHRVFAGAADKGLVFLPCELIADNGGVLRDIILRHAADWNLGSGFADWVRSANVFCNTLVDSIVPGYPTDDAEKLFAELGYADPLLSVAEPYHLWVIEAPASVAAEFPLDKAGFNVVFTGDLNPYRTRKVAVLNGGHTASVLAAFHAGLDTVGAMMDDPQMGEFTERAIFDEVLSTLSGDEADKKAYAAAVLDRFRNPFIRHQLLSISLNSVSKWKVRVLPTLKAFHARTGRLPGRLAFSLAALLHFYRGGPQPDGSLAGVRSGAAYPIKDDAAVLAAFAACRDLAPAERVARLLGESAFWGEDLRLIPGLAERVAADLDAIAAKGVRAALVARFAGR